MTQPWDGHKRRIEMQEVGTRDGLQSEAQFVATEDKIALVNALSQCGLARIEVTAFVSPLAIPALKDAEIVMNQITRHPGVIYSALRWRVAPRSGWAPARCKSHPGGA